MPGDSEVAPMSGETLTAEQLADAISDDVSARVGGQIDGVAWQVGGVVGQLDDLSGRVAALEADAQGVATRADLQAVTDSLATLEEASLQAGEIGPVLDDEIGTVIITLVGNLLKVLDEDGDGASDVVPLVTEIRDGIRDIAGTLVHPAMSTPFADYTVLEALLLLLVLWRFFGACADVLRGAFSWLRL